MNEGLEALERVHKFDSDLHIIYKELRDNSEDYKIIERELKTSDIIKHFIKSLGLTFIFLDEDEKILIIDSDEFEYWYKCETQEEYDSLKEVLL